MKLEQTHIDQIKIAFKKMKSAQDLLILLNQAKPLIYGEKAVPFELKQLTYYSNPKIVKKRYTDFKIKKKSGGERTIHAPVRGLKSIQKVLSLALQCVFEPHNAAMGFVKNKSIVDNAKLHVGGKYVYNLDLKDFFSSIDQARVWKCFQLEPFNLIGKNISKTQKKERIELPKSETFEADDLFSQLLTPSKADLLSVAKEIKALSNANFIDEEFCDLSKQQLYPFIKGARTLKNVPNRVRVSVRGDLAKVIAALCCTEMEVERKNAKGEWEMTKRNVLPQGAPTSPVITNIICQRLDYILTGVAKRFGLKYSRYADDITFSSMHNVYQSESDFIKEIHRVIEEQGFHIKASKTRLQKEGFRQEVTGLLVNEKVNVQQRYIKQLRMWLYYWEKYGYKKLSFYFAQQYLNSKVNLEDHKPDMSSVIAGKLDFLRMVKGVDNELYLKLKERFNKLIGKQLIADTISTQTSYGSIGIERVLYVWEYEGIENAMKLYYSNLGNDAKKQN